MVQFAVFRDQNGLKGLQLSRAFVFGATDDNNSEEGVPSDMMSASEGEWGHGKADVVREVA